ncbi:hypothetical protein QQS21_011194 [Conoideocrella luteorostrata]|uniref:Uncharacterized protein n=1 Tax=Conoideocrella luteorostrata TaxID=1105319 RepID=A0AAJ0CDS0_9HYPO|nr:hypothetical protein QQS21_011194 [Conoideocrella luteorostrata]
MDTSPRSSEEELILKPSGELFPSEHGSTEPWKQELRKTPTMARGKLMVAVCFLVASVVLNMVLGIIIHKSLLSRTRERWDEFTLPYEMSRITYEEALRLPNKTMPEAPYEGSGYLIILNVFHNLHCLDSIRQAIYYFEDPKWTSYNNPYTQMQNGDVDSTLRDINTDLSIHHIDHCIDILRQHQICTSDTTPNVFQYSTADFGIRAFANVLHECRDFDKVSCPTLLTPIWAL